MKSGLRPRPRALDERIFRDPIESRMAEMLARLDADDPLAALIIADSILEDHPDHGLAATCHAECVSRLQSLFLSHPRAESAPHLGAHATVLLLSLDGTRAIHSLVPRDALRRPTLCALHELVRCGVVAA